MLRTPKWLAEALGRIHLHVLQFCLQQGTGEVEEHDNGVSVSWSGYSV